MAGLPAGARALRTLAQAGCGDALLAVREAWEPGDLLRAETSRLCAGMTIGFGRLDEALQQQRTAYVGELLVDGSLLPEAASQASLSAAESGSLLRQAGRRIIRDTAKAGDGIVSRNLNRPISQTLTRLLLTWFPSIRPLHATCGTGVLAVIMTLVLLSCSPGGLVWGALLFQTASIFDGVDGEIARATFRSSPRGAAIDSLIDALTNLAFVAGVSWNLHCQGQERAGGAGAVGLVMMAIGLWLLGRRGRKDGRGMTFNAVKDRLNQRPSRIKQWLTWLTMRDFYALAGAILIAAGFAAFAVYSFALVAAGWLVVVVAVMLREPA